MWNSTCLGFHVKRDHRGSTSTPQEESQKRENTHRNRLQKTTLAKDRAPPSPPLVFRFSGTSSEPSSPRQASPGPSVVFCFAVRPPRPHSPGRPSTMHHARSVDGPVLGPIELFVSLVFVYHLILQKIAPSSRSTRDTILPSTVACPTPKPARKNTNCACDITSIAGASRGDAPPELAHNTNINFSEDCCEERALCTSEWRRQCANSRHRNHAKRATTLGWPFSDPTEVVGLRDARKKSARHKNEVSCLSRPNSQQQLFRTQLFSTFQPSRPHFFLGDRRLHIHDEPEWSAALKATLGTSSACHSLVRLQTTCKLSNALAIDHFSRHPINNLHINGRYPAITANFRSELFKCNPGVAGGFEAQGFESTAFGDYLDEVFLSCDRRWTWQQTLHQLSRTDLSRREGRHWLRRSWVGAQWRATPRDVPRGKILYDINGIRFKHEDIGDEILPTKGRRKGRSAKH